MRRTPGVMMFVLVLSAISTGIAQVVPSPVSCDAPLQVPLSAPTRSPTLQDVQNSKGPQLIAAPNPSVAPNPCSGFSSPPSVSGDATLIEDATKEITQNALEAGVSNAADIPAALPTNLYADGLSLLAQGTALVISNVAVKEILATTIPELLGNPWVTAGLGVTLNSSTTESDLQNRTGSVELVYHTMLDAMRQMSAMTAASDRFQLNSTCDRLKSA